MTASVFPSTSIPVQPGNAPSHSFYGCRFKALRVAGNFILSVIKAIVYKILSGMNWVIGRKAVSQRCGELARYHWNQGWNRLGAFIFLGKKVINFSTNSTARPKVSADNEPECLKDVYGDGFEERLAKADTSEFPIQKEKLSRLPIRSGICLGESLDFIGRFLKLHQENGLWFENIEQVSYLFKNGGTEESQITQILMHGQNTKELSERKVANREKFLLELEEQKKTVLQTIEVRFSELKTKYRLAAGDTPEVIDQKKEGLCSEIKAVKIEVQDEIERLQAKMYREIDEFEAKLDHQRLAPLAALHNIKLDLINILIDEDIKQSIPPIRFTEWLETLAPGPYLALLSCSKDASARHAISFVKESEERGYLFDPNFATVALESKEQQVQKLWSLTKRFYNTKGKCTLQFYHCGSI